MHGQALLELDFGPVEQPAPGRDGLSFVAGLEAAIDVAAIRDGDAGLPDARAFEQDELAVLQRPLAIHAVCLGSADTAA
jgi:hypothetical protein